MDASATETTTRILALLGPYIDNAGMVTPQQDLRNLGVTSMQMVDLMLSVEAEFDLTIPTTKLVPSNFRTLECIEMLVRELGH